MRRESVERSPPTDSDVCRGEEDLRDSSKKAKSVLNDMKEHVPKLHVVLSGGVNNGWS